MSIMQDSLIQKNRTQLVFFFLDEILNKRYNISISEGVIMIKMTNAQFLDFLKEQLGDNYQIGLHNVVLNRYNKVIKAKSNGDGVDINSCKEKYFIKKEKITHLDIINHILEKGLNVPKKSLIRTVMFLRNHPSYFLDINNISPHQFNYLFQPEKTEFIYNMLIAIPRYVTINDNEYHLGDMGLQTIGTDVIFKKKLPKEYIYGYYIKENPMNDNLEFHLNKEHFSMQTQEEQEKLFLNFLTEQDLDISLLEAARNDDSNYDISNIEHFSYYLKNTLGVKQKVEEEYKKINRKTKKRL